MMCLLCCYSEYIRRVGIAMTAAGVLCPLTFTVLCVVSVLGSHAFVYPFHNTSLDWETRVDDLVNRLTLHVSQTII